MEALPFEIRERIFNQFNTKDLCMIALVSPEWQCMSYQMLYKYPDIRKSQQLQLFSHISSYAQSFVQVLNLNIVYKYVTDKLFQDSLYSLTNLRQLSLDQCKQLSPSIIHSLILQNLFSITFLSLEDCRISQDTLALSYNHDLTILRQLPKPFFFIPHLAQLDLSHCAWFNNATLENIAQALPKLQHIELHWCTQITAEAIMNMVQNLKHLVTIDIRNIEAMGSSDQVEIS
ncbi:unnamed protein product [Rhizopus stolonifer]